MTGKNPLPFKTQSIGALSPAVLLAQAAEVPWKGLLIIGIVDGGPEADPGVTSVLTNSANLTTEEMNLLTRRLEYDMLSKVGKI